MRVLFPALPALGEQRWVEDMGDGATADSHSNASSEVSGSGGGGEGDCTLSVSKFHYFLRVFGFFLLGVMVDSSSVIFPHLLPRVQSSVFMLYALYYKRDDDEYWAR